MMHMMSQYDTHALPTLMLPSPRDIVWGLLRYSGSVGIEQLGGSIAEFAMYTFHQPTCSEFIPSHQEK